MHSIERRACNNVTSADGVMTARVSRPTPKTTSTGSWIFDPAPNDQRANFPREAQKLHFHYILLALISDKILNEF